MAGGTAILRGLARVVPARALRPFGRPVVFFFHGVERRIEDARIQRNQHTLDDFYKIAKSLKAGFQLLPLSALPDVLKHPENHARSAFLVSDDGYRNLRSNAADILDGLGLPWALFVSTHHIDTGELNPFTAARLFFYFGPAGRHAIPHLGAPVLLDEARERAAAHGLKKLRALDAPRGREAVDAMTAAIPRERLASLKERFQSERFLNWPELAELARRGVEIGAHAHVHWPMHKGASAETLARETRTSKERIENQIGACRFFAYPFGNIGDISPGTWKAVRDAGYSHAFTTLAGSLDAGSGNPWLLPRYGLRAEEPRLAAFAPMLRFANPRLIRWQKTLA